MRNCMRDGFDAMSCSSRAPVHVHAVVVMRNSLLFFFGGLEDDGRAGTTMV